MSVSVKTLSAAILIFGGAMGLQSAPASAQIYQGVPVFDGGYLRYRAGPPIGSGFAAPTVNYRPAVAGGWSGPRYGWGGGPYGPGYYGARSGWGGGYYRPAFYGPRYGYHGGYYPYRYYRRGWDGGGAVAAGLIGGLALGSIISAANNPYYYRPTYYRPTNCFVERRRVVNRYGKVIVRRVQTCY